MVILRPQLNLGVRRHLWMNSGMQRIVAIAMGAVVMGGAFACAPQGSRPAEASTEQGATCPPSGGALDSTGSITFDSTEVDHDAVAIQSSIPFTPPGPGSVVARFVIDSSGRADIRTLSIEPGGDPALGDYVLQLVPAARFRPAVRHGCRVRVWARWPFRAE